MYSDHAICFLQKMILSELSIRNCIRLGIGVPVGSPCTTVLTFFSLPEQFHRTYRRFATADSTDIEFQGLGFYFSTISLYIPVHLGVEIYFKHIKEMIITILNGDICFQPWIRNPLQDRVFSHVLQ